MKLFYYYHTKSRQYKQGFLKFLSNSSSTFKFRFKIILFVRIYLYLVSAAHTRKAFPNKLYTLDENGSLSYLKYPSSKKSSAVCVNLERCKCLHKTTIQSLVFALVSSAPTGLVLLQSPVTSMQNRPLYFFWCVTFFYPFSYPLDSLSFYLPYLAASVVS